MQCKQLLRSCHIGISPLSQYSQLHCKLGGKEKVQVLRVRSAMENRDRGPKWLARIWRPLSPLRAGGQEEGGSPQTHLTPWAPSPPRPEINNPSPCVRLCVLWLASSLLLHSFHGLSRLLLLLECLLCLFYHAEIHRDEASVEEKGHHGFVALFGQPHGLLR